MRWDMVSFADGPDADRVATSYRRESAAVSARPRIKIKLAPGGGWAARISAAGLPRAAETPGAPKAP